MITKKSSNDEVLHHLKQMELMLLSEDEEAGLKKILSISDVLKAPSVEHWLEDGVFESQWLQDTDELMQNVQKKLRKNHVIKEHLAQCRGFVAYNILLSKLEDGNLDVMYQNGEWLFALFDDRKERVCWVNQRFNICFFNTPYERKFLDLIKDQSNFEVSKSWLFKRESWFYSSDLFEELNTLLSKTTFQEISKAKVKIEDDALDMVDDVQSLEVTGTLDSTTEVSITTEETMQKIDAHIESIGLDEQGEVVDSQEQEDFPPLQEEEFGLFGSSVKVAESQQVVLEETRVEENFEPFADTLNVNTEPKQSVTEDEVKVVEPVQQVQAPTPAPHREPSAAPAPTRVAGAAKPALFANRKRQPVAAVPAAAPAPAAKKGFASSVKVTEAPVEMEDNPFGSDDE